ncbi:hypothetical protein H8A97_30465 [Bradyrhizobium sp. Arg62]|uniref:hypothetical protein n=1 Tax=Bradyrhizobium brasilense TaxID=1419277 RepID=UPI001E50536D|nr:hypothetical protein [Bradyrhizobium brasilense]MCC8949310.1 hypothetical protein [Bradyrhizobium brasilense]
MIEDTRIVYGFRCVWWDGIEKVGSKGQGPLGGLPCCPHCGSPLFEMPSPKEWWDGVERHQANGHPGYRDFIEWLKGRCFPTVQAAKAAYEAKPGRTVSL